MSNYYHLLAHLPDFVHIFRHCCSAVVTVNKSKCNFHSLFVKVSERLPELHANYFCIQCSVSAKVFAGDCCQFRAALHRNNPSLRRSQRQCQSTDSQRCAQLKDYRQIIPSGILPARMAGVRYYSGYRIGCSHFPGFKAGSGLLRMPVCVSRFTCPGIIQAFGYPGQQRCLSFRHSGSRGDMPYTSLPALHNR